jgi:hypothetical protein
VAEIPRACGKQEQRKQAVQRAEQSIGKQAAEHQAEPSGAGDERVPDDVRIGRKRALNNSRNQIEGSAIEMRAIDWLYENRTLAGEIRQEAQSFASLLRLVPRRTEVLRSEQHQREQERRHRDKREPGRTSP